MRLGWSWEQLMATPAPVVEAAIEWLNDLADEAEYAQRPPPGPEF